MTITLRMPDGVPLTATQERQAWAAIHGGGGNRRLGGRSGFRVDTPSTVLTATSTTWTLGACAAMIDPGALTHQGMYGWSSDANETGTVTAADATNPRKDIVYIQINDDTAGDGSGLVTAEVEYLAGTPGVTPSAPTLPARSFLVGTITVPQVGGGSPTVVRNPAVFVAAGGIQPVFSNTDLATFTPYSGFTIRRMDLPGLPLYVHDGTAYNRVVGGYVGYDKNTTTSTGIAGTEAPTDAIGTVDLIKGHKYEVVYQFTAVTASADEAFALRFKTAPVGSGGTTGTNFEDRTYWTSPAAGAGSTITGRGIYTPTVDETVRILATMQRVIGASGIDISNRVLTIEDKGYLP